MLKKSWLRSIFVVIYSLLVAFLSHLFQTLPENDPKTKEELASAARIHEKLGDTYSKLELLGPSLLFYSYMVSLCLKFSFLSIYNKFIILLDNCSGAVGVRVVF